MAAIKNENKFTQLQASCMRTFLKANESRPSASLSLFSVKDIVKEITHTLSQSYQVSDLLFQMSFEEDKMILRSDPGKIKQTLFCLLKNAIKEMG